MRLQPVQRAARRRSLPALLSRQLGQLQEHGQPSVPHVPGRHDHAANLRQINQNPNCEYCLLARCSRAMLACVSVLLALLLSAMLLLAVSVLLALIVACRPPWRYLGLPLLPRLERRALVWPLLEPERPLVEHQ